MTTFDELYQMMRESIRNDVEAEVRSEYEKAEQDSSNDKQLSSAPLGFEHVVLTAPVAEDVKRAYDRYQLAWMLEHGHSLDEYCDILVEHLHANLSEKFQYVTSTDVRDAMFESKLAFEHDSGFDGSVFASFAEWYDAEWSDAPTHEVTSDYDPSKLMVNDTDTMAEAFEANSRDTHDEPADASDGNSTPETQESPDAAPDATENDTNDAEPSDETPEDADGTKVSPQDDASEMDENPDEADGSTDETPDAESTPDANAAESDASSDDKGSEDTQTADSADSAEADAEQTPESESNDSQESEYVDTQESENADADTSISDKDTDETTKDASEDDGSDNDAETTPPSDDDTDADESEASDANLSEDTSETEDATDDDDDDDIPSPSDPKELADNGKSGEPAHRPAQEMRDLAHVHLNKPAMPSIADPSQSHDQERINDLLSAGSTAQPKQLAENGRPDQPLSSAHHAERDQR